jgi:RND family efflux transporter MFP subunit
MMATRAHALVALVLAAGCRASAPAARPPSPSRVHAVAAAAPSPAPATDDEGFLGIVLAPATVDVAAQLDGRIKDIAVRPGDRVRAGDLLAQLDVRSAQHELAVASAEVQAAKSEVDRARVEEAQAEERAARRATTVELPTATVATVSAEELSTARYQKKLATVRVSAADAALAQKQAHLQQLEALLAERALRAPFDGVVTTRYLDAGAAIHKGSVVVRMIESGELKVRFAVPEDRLDVAVGDPVRIVVGGQTLAGTLEKVPPEIDVAARMVFAEASLRAAPGVRLRSGQVARVFAASDR